MTLRRIKAGQSQVSVAAAIRVAVVAPSLFSGGADLWIWRDSDIMSAPPLSLSDVTSLSHGVNRGLP